MTGYHSMMIDDLRLIADCFDGEMHDKHRQTIRGAADEIERLERELETARDNAPPTQAQIIAAMKAYWGDGPDSGMTPNDRMRAALIASRNARGAA